jgi:excinuclease ABC subunit B
VSLVAILDADKEGYLRSESALIQTIGRAARHVDGQVIMYADTMTGSMQRAIDETYRRRAIQIAFNEEHGIEPRGIQKTIRDISNRVRAVAEQAAEYTTAGPVVMPKDEIARLIQDLEVQMRQAAKNLNFEEAAGIRDQVVELKKMLVAEQPLVPEAWMTRSNRGIEASVQGSGKSGGSAPDRRVNAPKRSRPGTSRGRR